MSLVTSVKLPEESYITSLRYEERAGGTVIDYTITCTAETFAETQLWIVERGGEITEQVAYPAGVNSYATITARVTDPGWCQLVLEAITEALARRLDGSGYNSW